MVGLASVRNTRDPLWHHCPGSPWHCATRLYPCVRGLCPAHGIIAIVVSLQERRSLRAWWVLLLEGALGIIFGILAFTKRAWKEEKPLNQRLQRRAGTLP